MLFGLLFSVVPQDRRKQWLGGSFEGVRRRPQITTENKGVFPLQLQHAPSLKEKWHASSLLSCAFSLFGLGEIRAQSGICP